MKEFDAEELAGFNGQRNRIYGHNVAKRFRDRFKPYRCGLTLNCHVAASCWTVRPPALTPLAGVSVVRRPIFRWLIKS